MKNKFLDKVAEQIEDEDSRELITAELESHLLDKIDYYVDIGYSKEEAEKRATEEMGNPDDTAVPLNALHNNNFRDLIYLNNGTDYLEESDNQNYKILTIKDGVVVDCYSD